MSRYLITFDLDANLLKEYYPANCYHQAYAEIKQILAKHGFANLQCTVYLSEQGVSEALATIAIQELTACYDWFYTCVSNIKFYRLESDLDAQFIADGVYQAKQAFLKRIEQLRLSLEQAGLTKEQIKKVLAEQNFEIDNLSMPLKIKE